MEDAAMALPPVVESSDSTASQCCSAISVNDFLPENPSPPDEGDAVDREVCVAFKRLPEASAVAEAALVAHNTPPMLFVHGGRLVRLTDDGGGLRLTPVTTTELQCDLAHAARWSEQTDAGTRSIYPPPLVVRDV